MCFALIFFSANNYATSGKEYHLKVFLHILGIRKKNYKDNFISAFYVVFCTLYSCPVENVFPESKYREE